MPNPCSSAAPTLQRAALRLAVASRTVQKCITAVGRARPEILAKQADGAPYLPREEGRIA